jgi:hypothetical protein
MHSLLLAFCCTGILRDLMHKNYYNEKNYQLQAPAQCVYYNKHDNLRLQQKHYGHEH